MENKIICNINCSLVVNINMCWLKLIYMQIYKYFFWSRLLVSRPDFWIHDRHIGKVPL